jgi:diaminopimelate epimerase
MMKFWKMHGLGNDYLLVDNRDEKIGEEEAAKLAVKLCERRFSVGADGLLFVSNSSIADVKMRIFNADGSEAEMCGNGIRCFAKYCYENDIVRNDDFNVETAAGLRTVWLTIRNREVTAVKVDMGVPDWNRSALPMQGTGVCINEDLKLGIEIYKITCLSVGNPHCIIFVENVDEFPVHYLGPIIENHQFFPKRTNVGFVEVLNKNELKVRVWERGCGETLACGTGAFAAVIVANKLKKVGNKVTVHVLYGDLQIEVGDHLFLSGPAEKVFEGKMF